MASLQDRIGWSSLDTWTATAVSGGSIALATGVITFAGAAYGKGGVLTDTLVTSLADGESVYLKLDDAVGDVVIRVHLESVSGGDALYLQARTTNSLVLYKRESGSDTSAGAASNWTPGSKPWLRLTRDGSYIEAYTSVDGAAWGAYFARTLFPTGGDLDLGALVLRITGLAQFAGTNSFGISHLNGGPAETSTSILPFLPLLAGDSDMRDLFYSPSGSADRLALEFDAWSDDGTPATGIEDVTPALRINGGTASDTHATGAAVEVRVGRYRCTVTRASVSPGDDVLVESFTGADLIFGGEGRVVAPDVGTPPATNAEMADSFLARNIAGSADGGHTVGRALKKVVNKKVLSAGTLTVYEEDGETPAFTETITGTSTVTGSDPA